MIEISGKRIGWGSVPILSAELSLNHGASLDRALEMIDSAAENGADGIKLQYFRAEDFSQPDGEMITYKQRTKKHPRVFMVLKTRIDEPQRYEYKMEEITESVYSLFKRHEISLNFVKACQQRAKEHQLLFGVTTTSIDGVKEMAEIGVDYLKIASDQIGKNKMIDEMKKSEIPIIVSTGHIGLMDIDTWPNSLWLHCVSSYPADNPKLWRLKHMTHKFNNVGYSHHGTNWREIVRATEIGSVWNEFHWTLDKTNSGPDNWFSLDPSELSQLVKAIK